MNQYKRVVRCNQCHGYIEGGHERDSTDHCMCETPVPGEAWFYCGRCGRMSKLAGVEDRARFCSDCREMPVRFALVRSRDGVGQGTGVGYVAYGVVWSNGRVSMQWRPPVQSIVSYDDLDQAEMIHVKKHPGETELVWLD